MKKDQQSKPQTSQTNTPGKKTAQKKSSSSSSSAAAAKSKDMPTATSASRARNGRHLPSEGTIESYEEDVS